MAEGFNYVECCPCLFATSVASSDDNAGFIWIAQAWAFVKVSWVRVGDKKGHAIWCLIFSQEKVTMEELRESL